MSTFDERWALPIQPQYDIVGDVPNVPTIYPAVNPNNYLLPTEQMQFGRQIPELVDNRLINDYQVNEGVPVLNRLFGTGQQERFQTWPERMAVSGATLPADVYSGRLPVDFNDEVKMEPNWLGEKLGMSRNWSAPASTSVIGRAQDLSGMAGMSTLGIKPGTASVGSGPVVYHGTPKAGFERFKTPEVGQYMPDRELGTHFSKDPEIANTFVKTEGGVYPVKLQNEGKFLEVKQELHPYIEDRSTPKNNRNVNSDQNAIEKLIYSTVYKKDPEMLARYLVEARAVPEADALALAKNMVKGKEVELPVDGKITSLDKFIDNFGGKPYNQADRTKAVEIFKKEMQDQGYEGIKYINTSPMETAGAKDFTSYVVFDTSKSVRSKYTNTLMEDTKAATGIAGLHSSLQRTIENSKVQKATPEQWQSYLKNQPGVKPEELEFGLSNLPNKQITKEELLAHAQENGIKLGEVHLGEMKFNKNSPYAIPEVIKAAKEAGNHPGDLELTLANDGRAYEALMKKFPQLRENEDWASVVSKDVFGGDTMPKGTTKYQSYQLPGAEPNSYRELLLTLPEKQKPKIEFDDWFKKNYPTGNLEEFKGQSEGVQRPVRMQYIKETENFRNRDFYQSSHWDEPNVLAHVRMNDRVISEPGYRITNLKSGNTSKTFKDYDEALKYANELPESLKNNIQINEGAKLPFKTLHIEEIQSDWHQAGRKEGYKSGEYEQLQQRYDELTKEARYASEWYEPRKGEGSGGKGLKDAVKAVDDYVAGSTAGGKLFKDILPEEQASLIRIRDGWEKTLKEKYPEGPPKRPIGEVRKEIGEVYNKMVDQEGFVPNAPFKKTWDELALKKAITEAVNNGYDAVSWTPGEAQAARYDLSQQLNKLQYEKLDNGKYNIAGVTKRGDEFSHPEPVTEQQLVNVVGKEMAEKIVKGEGKKNEGQNWEGGYFDGIDLKVGGSGMKAFYDKMLVDKANALVKKMGGKVEYEHLPVSQQQRQEILKNRDNIGPDQIAQEKYKKQWNDLVKEKNEISAEMMLADSKKNKLYREKGKDDPEYINFFKNEYKQLYTKQLQNDNALDALHNKSVEETIQRLMDKVKGERIPIIKITPTMREKIKSDGFPLFSSGVPTFTPVDDPWKKREPKLTPIDYNPFQ